MDGDEGLSDEEAHPPLLPPDDRLWRHPSEVAAHGLPVEDGDGAGDGAGAGPPARRPGPPGRRLWMVAAMAAGAGAVCTVAVVAATVGLRERVRTVPAVERIVLPASTFLPAPGPEAAAGVAELAERVRPAIVRLEVERDGASGTGTGVLFRSDGHLVTNLHVVRDGDAVVAVLSDGRRGGARLVGSDEASDLAVLEVDGWAGVPTVPMGSALTLSVGQAVVTIGEGRPAWVSEVRALGRQLDRDGGPDLVDMIETDRPVTPGYSGGALLDATGAVVGIVTAVDPVSGGGSGFATPIDYARSVAEQLVATGRAVPVWIGVEGTDLDGATAVQLGLGGGAVITAVRDASPAGAAGLSPADVITAVDKVPVASMGALRTLLRAHRPGDVVRLAVVRDAARTTIRVRLAERPAEG
ncbi:MAG: S1C family serine protease [Actinomycetota bacterium]